MKTGNKILFVTFFIAFIILILLVFSIRSIFHRISFMPGPVIIKQAVFNAEKTTVSEKNFNSFDVINVSGAWNVSLQYGEKYKIKIHSSPAIEPYVKVTKNNRTLNLNIANQGWKNFADYHLTAEIITPKLRKISVSGAANVAVNGFDLQNLKVDSSGASHVYGKECKIKNLFLNSSGAAAYNFLNCKIQNAKIDSSGASQIKLNMDGGNLTGSISGISEVRYKGDIKTNTLDISGISSVKKMKES